MPLKSFFFLIVALVAVGCRRTPSPNGLITSFGDYASPDKRHTLKVERKSKSLVVGSIWNAEGKTVFTETIGSDAMRWCFYWSPDGTLWAYSSDTGYFKKVKPSDEGAAPEVRKIAKGEKVPEAIFDFLPSTLHRPYKTRASKLRL